jgi:hypothetical protein
MSEPIHIISLGAGVQSSTMALMAAHGEITPMPKCAIFADTQDEPQSVYTWLDWLEKQLPFPVHRVTAGKLSEKSTRSYFSDRNQKLTVSGIPAFGDKGRIIFPRQCTSDFKVIPINREITRQMRDSGVKRCIKWIGISLDEIHRMKPSRRNSVSHIWPLIDARISRNDCLNWMKKRGYEEPPRSACTFCPYHSDNEWRKIKRNTPLEFQAVVDFENRLQMAYANVPSIKNVPFLHRSCVPIDQVDFSTDEDHGQQVMFGNECEGMCGV